MMLGRNRPVVKFHRMRWASEYLSEPLPNPVFPIDVTEGISKFGMQGNDTYGDCGPAGEVHLEMTTSIAAGDPYTPPADLAVVRYNAYDGNQGAPGPGVDLASYALWCYKAGFIKAFAPVDQTNKAQMQGLMAAGLGLWIGVNLTDQNMDQTNAGQPWTGAGGPDPNNGHCVLWVGSQTPTGQHSVVTWGQIQRTDDSFIEQCLIANPDGEAFLIVTTEEQAAKFSPALFADVAELGGTGPTPAPAPSVVADLEALDVALTTAEIKIGAAVDAAVNVAPVISQNAAAAAYAVAAAQSAATSLAQAIDT